MISYQSEHGTEMKNVVQKIVKTTSNRKKNKRRIISFNLCGQSGNGTKHTHRHTHVSIKTWSTLTFQCKLGELSQSRFHCDECGYATVCDMWPPFPFDGAFFANISHLKNLNKNTDFLKGKGYDFKIYVLEKSP